MTTIQRLMVVEAKLKRHKVPEHVIYYLMNYIWVTIDLDRKEISSNQEK